MGRHGAEPERILVVHRCRDCRGACYCGVCSTRDRHVSFQGDRRPGPRANDGASTDDGLHNSQSVSDGAAHDGQTYNCNKASIRRV